jgi:hypothetical protein
LRGEGFKRSLAAAHQMDAAVEAKMQKLFKPQQPTCRRFKIPLRS